MRFYADGPDIPDDLLQAADEGRLAIVSGAGVSMANGNNMPGFFGLAERVMNSLGALPESEARRALNIAREIGGRADTPGNLFAGDTIFGYLAQEFDVDELNNAVAAALNPGPFPNIQAHLDLIRIGTSPTGSTRLITTNLDRLFEVANGELPQFVYPRLPVVDELEDLHGLVYLHGRVSENYRSMESRSVVLTPPSFGRAYLLRRWATDFLKDVLKKYVVLFVGYSADDPPVKYLLEALKDDNDAAQRIFAFYSNRDMGARASWQRKNALPIEYRAQGDDHSNLYDTLSAWADRVEHPARWRAAIIEMAQAGPAALSPYQRGQVAHLVSTELGAKDWANADPPPPPSWLMVFDKSCRLAERSRVYTDDGKSRHILPARLFGLDNETIFLPAPQSEASTQKTEAKSSVPENRKEPSDTHKSDGDKKKILDRAYRNAWSAFTPTEHERQDIATDAVSGLLSGPYTPGPYLLQRHDCLKTWIAKVAHTPTAIWWAAGQAGLHWQLINEISRRMAMDDSGFDTESAQAWRYILEDYRTTYRSSSRMWHQFERNIRVNEWTANSEREFQDIDRPRVVVARNNLLGPAMPLDVSALQVIDRQISYADTIRPDRIPRDVVNTIVPLARENLERAITLVKEIYVYGWLAIPPFNQPPEDQIDSHTRTHGLPGMVHRFAAYFAQLIEIDPAAARQEFDRWPLNDHHIFDHLRIWVAGQTDLLSADEAGQTLLSLTSLGFWESSHRRDLLHSLRAKWQNLSRETRVALEQHILAGPEQGDGEGIKDFGRRRRHGPAAILTWLAHNDCELSPDTAAKLATLVSSIDGWDGSYWSYNDAAYESRGGIVQTDTDYHFLLHVPVEQVLALAQEATGRTDDLLQRTDPFKGLCENEPDHAFAALEHAASNGNYPEWAWYKFLWSDVWNDYNGSLLGRALNLLAAAPNDALSENSYAICYWLQTVSDQGDNTFWQAFPTLFDRLVTLLEQNPALGETGITTNQPGTDWRGEMLNSCVGNLARTVQRLPAREAATQDTGLPDDWKQQIERLLRLDGNLHRHAITALTFHLHGLHNLDPAWVEQNLLPILATGTTDDRDAWWQGYLWQLRYLPSIVLFNQLKSHLINRLREGRDLRESRHSTIANLVLAMWANIKNDENGQQIDDEELTRLLLDVGDNLRVGIIWCLNDWLNRPDSSFPFSRALKLFQSVWPRQLAAKTTETTSALVDFLNHTTENFAELAQAIIPHLTKLPPDDHEITFFLYENTERATQHPEETLAILDAIIPERMMWWPHHMAEILENIIEGRPELARDPRYIELRRKWDSR